MKNLIFLFIYLLIISPTAQAKDSDENVLSCSDPIPQIRWPELCKEGYNLDFLVDYFQGKYNDASYDQYESVLMSLLEQGYQNLKTLEKAKRSFIKE